MPIASSTKTFPCLCCGKLFETESNALNHMNQPRSTCRHFHEDATHFAHFKGYTNGDPDMESPPNFKNLNGPDAVLPMEGVEQDSPAGPSIFAHPTPREFVQCPHHEEFPRASSTWNQTHPSKTFMELFAADPLASRCTDLPYYLFSTRNEWEIKLLQLSFQTAQDLISRAEQLPSGPRWVATSITPTFPTKNTITLYYRNPVLCLEALMRSPLVKDFIQFTPFRLYETCAKTMRIYTEWLSGDAAWFMQEKLWPGATLLGMILSSDKTNISSGTGNCVGHPLLISLANIFAEFRNKATNQAFLLLALIPIPKFIHPQSKFRGILEARLFHECLDIVLHPLKNAARVGVMLSDPVRNNAVEDEWDIAAFEREAMKYRLNGVHKPFWKDWDLSNPGVFLTSKPLHHWHRMFWDHDTKWCINAVGAAEIDFHFSILHSHTGYRHFKEGISSLKQVTGRDQHDIQRYIVPKAIIDAGARQGEKRKVLSHWQIPKLEFMQSVVSGIRLNGSAIQWLADTTEHAHIRLVKDPAQASNNQRYESQIVCALDRQDKLMNFDLATTIKEAGIEFTDRVISTDSPARETYDQEEELEEPDGDGATDNKFRSFTIGTTAELLSLISSVRALPGAHAGEAGISTYGITNYFYKASILKNGNDPSAKVPHHTIQSSPTTIFHLSRDPQLGTLTIDEAAKQFGIGDLRLALSQYLAKMEAIRPNTFISELDMEVPAPNHSSIVEKIQVWTSLHLQSTTYHYPHPILPPVTLKAGPHLGGHDSAIFCVDPSSQWPQSGLTGHVIGDLRLVFRLVLPKNHSNVPDRLLVYTQQYSITPQPNPYNPNTRQKGDFPDPNTGLYLLK
ncbi:hypothetical protein BJ165DRAFT_1416964 [Panaeolus papilionaceus]|nr:hypothetical protein BJ165DRAFT_1416964 [Panaeolus papilionaceus]